MRRRTYLATTAALGVATVAGCTGGDSNTGGGADQTTSTAGSDGNSTTVSMVDTSFDPETVSVSAGTTVVWQNEDGFGHDVTATTLTDAGDDWSFESGTVAGGESTEYTFADAGVYEYYCSIHGEQTMCGVVLVGDQQYDATLPCDSGGVGSGY